MALVELRVEGVLPHCEVVLEVVDLNPVFRNSIGLLEFNPQWFTSIPKKGGGLLQRPKTPNGYNQACQRNQT